MSRTLIEETIEKIENAFLASKGGQLKVVGILQGSTEKARSYSHIFVPGELYGGKLGSMLCRRPWINFHVYGKSEVKSELCKQCQEKLRKMAIIAADMMPQELFEIAGGAGVAPISAEDVGLVLKEYARRERRRKIKPEYVPMFDDAETKVAVRKTSLWTPPTQSSTLETINRLVSPSRPQEAT